MVSQGDASRKVTVIGAGIVGVCCCPFHKLELYEIGELPTTKMLTSFCWDRPASVRPISRSASRSPRHRRDGGSTTAKPFTGAHHRH